MEIVMEGTSGLHSSVSHPVNDISVRENGGEIPCGIIQPKLVG